MALITSSADLIMTKWKDSKCHVYIGDLFIFGDCNVEKRSIGGARVYCFVKKIIYSGATKELDYHPHYICKKNEPVRKM